MGLLNWCGKCLIREVTEAKAKKTKEEPSTTLRVENMMCVAQLDMTLGIWDTYTTHVINLCSAFHWLKAKGEEGWLFQKEIGPAIW